MRALFFVLVLANVVFFAYVNWLRAPDGSAELIPKLQVHPERIRILGSGEKVRTGSAPRDASACLEWTGFAGADVARADTAVATLQLPGVMVQRAVADAEGYWVYLPPMKTKAEVDKRVAALKAHGVKDFYVVQEAGQWRNAISLGIFKSEDTARGMAAKLKDSGVQGVALERRENMLKQVVYFVREPDPAAVARLAELQRDFPGTEVKAVPCPPGGKNAG
jgi:SPOR domain